MRVLTVLCFVMLSLMACNDAQVYEQITDFEKRQWVVTEKPEFEFVVDDISNKYNLYTDVRNTISYPYARFFFTYYLKDSTGAEIQKDLMTEFLFDAKTGKPFGKSGIGDLYDHRFTILKDYQFAKSGKYKIQLEQFMRVDTLPGILAVGVRVEKASVR